MIYVISMQFVTVSISTTVLLSSDYGVLEKYTWQLKYYFVKQFEILYMEQFLTFNVHGLLH